MSKKSRLIVWAVDPFELEVETRPQVNSMIRKLLESGSKIEPVYVMSPDQFELNMELTDGWTKAIRPKANEILEQALKKTLRDVKHPGMSKPRLLMEKQPSLSRSVKALSDYAFKANAQFILLGSHSRRGISRLLMGSFAESLMLLSKVPVLVVPHQKDASAKSSFDAILVPTDFGPGCDPVLKKIISFAKSNHSSITLYHRFQHPVEPFLKFGVYLLGGGSLTFPELMSKEEQKKRRHADRIVQMGAKLGVDVKVEFVGGEGNTAQAIVERASSDKANLIVMSTSMAPAKAMVLGTVTRQVVRDAPCPVWVLHGK